MSPLHCHIGVFLRRAVNAKGNKPTGKRWNRSYSLTALWTRDDQCQVSPIRPKRLLYYIFARSHKAEMPQWSSRVCGYGTPIPVLTSALVLACTRFFRSRLDRHGFNMPQSLVVRFVYLFLNGIRVKLKTDSARMPI